MIKKYKRSDIEELKELSSLIPAFIKEPNKYKKRSHKCETTSELIHKVSFNYHKNVLSASDCTYVCNKNMIVLNYVNEITEIRFNPDNKIVVVCNDVTLTDYCLPDEGQEEEFLFQYSTVNENYDIMDLFCTLRSKMHCSFMMNFRYIDLNRLRKFYGE